MAFDWQYFAQHGLAPAFGNVQQMMAANLQRQLARERHQQTMSEMQEQYRLREEEQARVVEHDLRMMAERKALAEATNNLERGNILLRSTLDREQTDYAAKKRMGVTAFEEGLKHKYATEEDQLRFNLNKLAQDDPEKMNVIYTNTIQKNLASLATLEQLEAVARQEQAKLASLLGDSRTLPEEKAIYQRQLRQIESNASKYAHYRQQIDKQMRAFERIGVTDQGIVPKDRRDYLQRMVQVLEDKMYERDLGLKDIPPDDIIPTLNQLAQETGTDVEFTPADIKFLFANFWTDIKASFRKPPKR